MSQVHDSGVAADRVAEESSLSAEGRGIAGATGGQEGRKRRMTGKRMERTMRAECLGFPGGAAEAALCEGGTGMAKGRGAVGRGETRDGGDDAGVADGPRAGGGRRVR